MKGCEMINQGFLLSKSDNDKLEVKLKRIGWTKTQFYREITKKWINDEVIVKAADKHALSI